MNNGLFVRIVRILIWSKIVISRFTNISFRYAFMIRQRLPWIQIKQIFGDLLNFVLEACLLSFTRDSRVSYTLLQIIGKSNLRVRITT